MNTRLIRTLEIALVLFGAGFFASARADYGPAKQLHFDLDRSVDKKLTLMSKKLNLDPNQGYRVKQALEDQANKMDLLKKEYLDARKKIADDTDGTFLAILNPEQQQLYQKIKPDILGRDDQPDTVGPSTYHGDERP